MNILKRYPIPERYLGPAIFVIISEARRGGGGGGGAGRIKLTFERSNALGRVRVTIAQTEAKALNSPSGEERRFACRARTAAI